MFLSQDESSQLQIDAEKGADKPHLRGQGSQIPELSSGALFRAMLDVLRTVHYDRETGWNRTKCGKHHTRVVVVVVVTHPAVTLHSSCGCAKRKIRRIRTKGDLILILTW